MGAKTQNKFVRIITMPIRALGKARDFYVRSMTGCAGSMNYGSIAPGSALPKSFSVNSSTSNGGDDYRDLIRAASARSLGNRINVDMILQQQGMIQQPLPSKGLPKSCSVGMGRIDEDDPSDFGEDGVVDGKPNLLFPRSKTVAVTKRNIMFSDLHQFQKSGV
ncbi:3-isopropylmalate dehydratase large subunit like [Quillaja saponaria]|uniref:3-isopropylmalate dehydratase large subunit like n=1 Tax=Quillaja saponaria TaxID=32244 RepID=A0AAD7M0I0_QUISA|nr:3-isopropylmalate dehydratase large subunit like [Quillaja saponaria]